MECVGFLPNRVSFLTTSYCLNFLDTLPDNLNRVVELNVAIIVSCAPAIASSWNHILRDSKFMIHLRSA